MSKIRSTDTKPELVVTELLESMGQDFSTHAAELPGSPDIVLTDQKKVIFVHGCFWHKHKCQRGSVVPKTNAEYWQTKRQGTVERTKKAISTLRSSGWTILVVWECETANVPQVEKKLEKFLAYDATHLSDADSSCT